MNISDYLMAFRDYDGNGHPEGEKGYKSSFPLARRIACVDGFSMSVQATHGAYCSPRQNIGPWYEVEVGFPSAKPELISQFAEQDKDYTKTVYPYVDIELVEKLVDLHGGPSAETLEAAENAKKANQS